ncbi:MAG: nucleotidyltransferase [Butyrivibrio sp.]|nr:nucleotidyltransferase [Butyrivibrio sp.]
MSTIGIIAEFNPFHNGHSHLIEECKKITGADNCIVIMSGDFVQRGAPALTDKFTRARMALSCGADLVLELPVYYSTGSAEYFARGAVSILDKIGAVDYLCFGSELGDISLMDAIADILNNEPKVYRDILAKELKKGSSFAAARDKALTETIKTHADVESTKLAKTGVSIKSIKSAIASPNNILAIEYLRALKMLKSKMKPITIQREGAEYNSEKLSAIPSALSIRNLLAKAPISHGCLASASRKKLMTQLKDSIPKEALSILFSDDIRYVKSDDFSSLLKYKLVSERFTGYEAYLDVTEDISNKIIKNLDSFDTFEDFCMKIKSKDITYSRISRCLIHILLNIRKDNMQEYTSDSYTGYVRILGQKASAKKLLSKIQDSSSIPVLNRLKDAPHKLSGLQMKLFEETLNASSIYNLATGNSTNEYRLKPVIM